MQPLTLHRTTSNGNANFEPEDPATVPPWAAGAELRAVGQRYPRVEAVEKVTGSARYTYDVRLARQIYGRVLRSPHAHARIRRIDASRAEHLPGVHAVLTCENVGDVRWYGETVPILDRTLRFVGDEVAAVAAESEEIADDALRLIEVEYETLPFIPNLEAALASDPPLIHQKGPLAAEPETYSRGDIATGERAADVVITQTYVTQTALHNCLEPHGTTASWDGDHLTLWDSTQAIFAVRDGIAQALHLPRSNVRVIK